MHPQSFHHASVVVNGIQNLHSSGPGPAYAMPFFKKLGHCTILHNGVLWHVVKTVLKLQALQGKDCLFYACTTLNSVGPGPNWNLWGLP